MTEVNPHRNKPLNTRAWSFASSSSSEPSESYWNYATDSLHVATDSLQTAAESSYNTLSDLVASMTPKSPSLGRRRRHGDFLFPYSYSHHNPHVVLRRHNNNDDGSSMTAVRSLLSAVVPPPVSESSSNAVHVDIMDETTCAGEEQGRGDELLQQHTAAAAAAATATTSDFDLHSPLMDERPLSTEEIRNAQPSWHTTTTTTTTSNSHTPAKPKKGQWTPTESASQLAEGTLRALRDMQLHEAVELSEALDYWNDRWERPILGWLEAGPAVWMSREGYNHQLIGQKVSQIQAVLVRRCAAIGELQSHLLNAGWQRGVAQWGFLGQAGQWAPVAGFDGSMPDDDHHHPGGRQDSSSGITMMDLQSSSTLTANNNNRRLSVQIDAPHRSWPSAGPSYKTNNVLVRKQQPGIFLDEPGRLAEWSIEAMSLIRRHLYRSGNGMVALPFQSNWVAEGPLPVWAAQQAASSNKNNNNNSEPSTTTTKQLTVSNLPLFVSEVEELLNIMEDIMQIQRARRLDKMRAPRWMRRNWFLVVTAGPLATALSVWLIRHNHGQALLRSLSHSISSFLKEHLKTPLVGIVNELWRGRENFSDKKARTEAIESLKKMIRAWLDDYYPDMPEAKRARMAANMDISLVELKKEESMKTFFEINNVIRMSFIEMQYMKKEMMNALHAMDQMMSSNDMNMNVAAITPAVILAYSGTQLFKFMYYAMLKLGKSRDEVYASFRNTLTDIERLLVMRDNPPLPPDAESTSAATNTSSRNNNNPCKLGPDDLGMLMLLVHECRTVMWKNRRRFPECTIQSVSEDLSELTGERGAVSIRQQLHIINRMCRTYPFLKVGRMVQSRRFTR